MFAFGGFGLYFHGQEGLAAIFSLFVAILEKCFLKKISGYVQFVHLLAHSVLFFWIAYNPVEINKILNG